MGDVFELAKTVDIKEYIESRYGLTFKNNKILCPFHKDRNPSLSFYRPTKTLTCFGGCGWNDGKNTGDIIDFVSKYERIGKLEAAKRVCDDNLIAYNTKYEHMQSGKSHWNAPPNENERRKQLAREMTEKAHRYVKDAMTQHEKFEKALAEVAVNRAALPSEWKSCYLGWDNEEDSLVIISQSHISGQVWNIKHRKKRGFDGKWISYPGSKAFPFPFEYFKQHGDDRVILCEGEKDALNLLCLGVNCLTLGGVTTSWQRFKELLRDKDVFIWFDHDQAGYENALKKYDEVSETARNTYLLLFCTMGNGFSNHYDISDFIKESNISGREELFAIISRYSLTNKTEAAKAIDRAFQSTNTESYHHEMAEANTSSTNTVAHTATRSFWKQNSALLVVTVCLLVIALSVHQQLPYEFYTLNRVVNFSVFSIVAFFSLRERDINFAIVFGILAFLFNPIKPFWLTRTLWVIVDAVVLLVIGYYLFGHVKLLQRLMGRNTHQ